MVRRHTYRDHVLRDVLTELDAGIISTCDEVDPAVIGCDVEQMSGYWRANAPSRGARIVFAAKREATIRTRPVGVKTRSGSTRNSSSVMRTVPSSCART